MGVNEAALAPLACHFRDRGRSIAVASLPWRLRFDPIPNSEGTRTIRLGSGAEIARGPTERSQNGIYRRPAASAAMCSFAISAVRAGALLVSGAPRHPASRLLTLRPLVLAARWSASALRHRHPLGRPPPALSASNRQAFQHGDGFDESLSFESEIGQHLIDVHNCRISILGRICLGPDLRICGGIEPFGL